MDVSEIQLPIAQRPVAAFVLRVASVLALPMLSFLCYAGSYVTGLIYRGAYLAGFNVPSGLFKSETSDYFVYAYLAVLETFKNWSSFLSNPYVWGAMILVISLFTLEILLLRKAPETRIARALGVKIDSKRYVAISAGIVSFSTAITMVLLLIPLILLPVLILPGVVGNYGAKQALARELTLYKHGCEHVVDSKDNCHVLMKGAHIVAAGFLVSSSEERVALYLDGRTTIIPIAELTLTTVTPENYKKLLDDQVSQSVQEKQ